MNWMWLTIEENINMHRVTFPAQTQCSSFKGQAEKSTGYDISLQKVE